MSKFEKLAGAAVLAASLGACESQDGDTRNQDGNYAKRDTAMADIAMELQDVRSEIDTAIIDGSPVDSSQPVDKGLSADLPHITADSGSASLSDSQGVDMAGADAAIPRDVANIPADAAARESDISTDAALIPDVAVVEADAALSPQECPIPPNCARIQCAQAEVISVDIIQGEGEITDFGGLPEPYVAGTRRSLTCETYNQGTSLDFLLDDRLRTTILDVQSSIAGLNTGVWWIEEGRPLEFIGRGQQPPGAPAAIASDHEVVNIGQVEVFAPYYPIHEGH